MQLLACGIGAPCSLKCTGDARAVMQCCQEQLDPVAKVVLWHGSSSFCVCLQPSGHPMSPADLLDGDARLSKRANGQGYWELA